MVLLIICFNQFDQQLVSRPNVFRRWP